jgi:hypothetical protein
MHINPSKDDVVFMQIDTDYYTAVPLSHVRNALPN